MTHLRNIALDLVEKRLWPVAVVLLAAIAAVPLLLGSDARPAPVAPAAVVPGAGPASAQIALAGPGGGTAASRLGPLRDPFARARAARAAAASRSVAPDGVSRVTGGTPAAGDDSGAGAGLGATTLPGGGGAGLPDLSWPDTGATGDPAPGAAGPDVVTVRIGRAGELDLRRDVAVRSPLPSVGDPFLVYLGNKPDGASAQFLVSADAVVSGEGGCRPTPELCEEIVLQAGMTARFDVEGADGEVVRHQLEVVRVGRG